MKICPVCHTENEEDALYCKRCATAFFEANEENNHKKRDKVKKQKKVKNKTKIKYKTKVQKEKAPKEKQKSSFFSKLLVFVLLLIVIALAGAVGMFAYHYYQENNIEVPNVVGYSYEEATGILEEAKLSYQQKEELTTEEDEVGVVLKQSKRAGSKTHENTIITLTVGVLDTHVIVPDVLGLTLEEAIHTLNQVGISYQVVYEESDEEENIVLKQSIRSGKEINNTESITLTISISTSENSSSDSSIPEEDSSSENEENTNEIIEEEK